jgi:hypothetical protein
MGAQVKYNGDGTYTITIEVTVTAAAGGEARRKALFLEEHIDSKSYVSNVKTIKESRT